MWFSGEVGPQKDLIIGALGALRCILSSFSATIDLHAVEYMQLIKEFFSVE